MERTKKQIANTAFWIAALRSGQYQQTTEHLTTVDEDGTNPRHCCLGVACVIMGKVGTVRGTAVTYDGKNDEWGTMSSIGHLDFITNANVSLLI